MASKDKPGKSPESKQIVAPKQHDVKPVPEVVDLPTGARSHPPVA